MILTLMSARPQASAAPIDSPEARRPLACGVDPATPLRGGAEARIARAALMNRILREE